MTLPLKLFQNSGPIILSFNDGSANSTNQRRIKTTGPLFKYSGNIHLACVPLPLKGVMKICLFITPSNLIRAWFADIHLEWKITIYIRCMYPFGRTIYRYRGIRSWQNTTTYIASFNSREWTCSYDPYKTEEFLHTSTEQKWRWSPKIWFMSVWRNYINAALAIKFRLHEQCRSPCQHL